MITLNDTLLAVQVLREERSGLRELAGRMKKALERRDDALTIAMDALRHYAGGHWPHNSLARGALEQVERLLEESND